MTAVVYVLCYLYNTRYLVIEYFMEKLEILKELTPLKEWLMQEY